MRKPAAVTMRKSVENKALRGKNRNGRGRNEHWNGPDEEMYKPIKKPVTLRLDADVLAWFKGQGRGYQTRINRALRGVVAKERKAS